MLATLIGERKGEADSRHKPVAGYLPDTPCVARAYCPGCEPDADPSQEILDVRWCESHSPARDGADDEVVTASAYLSGSAEAGGYFFFQAEDGIRDLTLTGVQTCALPISFSVTRVDASQMPVPAEDPLRALQGKIPANIVSYSGRPGAQPSVLLRGPTSINAQGRGQDQIGRASCRERV